MMPFKQLPPRQCAELAIELRNRSPRLAFDVIIGMTTASKAHRALVAYTFERVIQYPADITHFIACYWLEGKRPLSKQVKLGLARAFNKFPPSELSEYRDSGTVKLCDLIALVHPKPKSRAQGLAFARLCNDSFLPIVTKSARYPVARVYRGLKK